MPFELHVSNDLHALAGRMKNDLAESGRTLDPFQPQFILTQTEGMKTWLQHLLATELGVAANLEFLQPGNLVSRLQYYLLGGPEKEILSRDEMCWGIYALLNEAEFKEKFPEQATYFFNDDIRRVAFARKLADLFDQYQVYRWRTVAEWNKFSVDKLNELTDWQSYIWCALRNRYGMEGFDRVDLSDQLIAKLESVDGSGIRERIPQLHLFGIAVVTPFFLRIFHALARHVEIRMYLINPAPLQYWLDDISEKRLAWLRGKRSGDPDVRQRTAEGNDLLLNWGNIVRDSFKLLFQNEELINMYNESTVAFPKTPTGLLQQIQWSVFQNTPTVEIGSDNDMRITMDHIRDGSIVINGCYTPAREVEVLFNYLAGLIQESGGKLAAREILVLVSDIDRYAPYIRSVFGQARDGEGEGKSKSIFPYTIADDSVTADTNLLSSLLKILDFDGDTFKAEEVLGLLEVSMIRERFDLEDLEKVRQAVREADIHFGLKGGRRGDDGDQYSWELGIQRMIIGWCMLVPEDYEFRAGGRVILPLSSSEGDDGLTRIRLAYFVRMLADKIARRKEDKTVSEWIDYVKGVVDDMIFDPDGEDTESYPEFVRMVEEISLIRDPFGQKISFEVFRHQFRHRLADKRRSGKFATKGITFCSLVPMRSIPFKVVAMLGMNFNDFPRYEDPLTFSLLAKRELGDRNVSENDNHLFLETLMSAREKLYLSYIARSEKDGSVLPPSALIDEMVDFVARTANMDTDDLRSIWVQIHPLHSFSGKYDGKNLKNFLPPARFKTGVDLNEIKDPGIPPIINRIELKKLSAFLENPQQHFLNLRFQIRYDWNKKELISDQELFELDRLQESFLGREIIKTSDEDEHPFIQSQSRLGLLPAGNLGQAAYLNKKEELKDFLNVYKAETQSQKETSVAVAVQISNFELEGRVGGIFETENEITRVAFSISSRNQKYFLRGFLDFLVLTAAGKRPAFVFIDRDGIFVRVERNRLTPEVANQYLKGWIDLFVSGSGALLPFNIEFLEKVNKHRDDLLKLKQELNSLMTPGGFNKYEIDASLMRAWEDGFLNTDSKLKELIRLSDQFLKPFEALDMTEHIK